ncbi:MAG: Glycosyl transferase family 39 [Candidatus Shapirobacteria bacterium GW2011_GWE1_38_10]|uniref:Glycosyl transferase family 39 n=1 Tax=Candidatus Shapirobacteria bacterium GW2011_GWE1_38_10 TaxID=1618488 RepID=A0A0G0LB72_9BACT|nr:MAG: Glycosyl transferase family 39 [Candidatus Shapirobacteria bacterium GW2011_GWE1_38_10]
MKIFSKKNIPKIIIFLVFILAFLLRIYGLNWDSNNHLHPDERFLTMVTADIKLPSSLSEYLNTLTSPLNPYNYPQYQFFVYGTFPLFLVKTLAVFLHLDNYNQITLLGRVLSALFDSGNVVLLYFIARKFLKSFYRYLPSLLYAFLVIPLQLSHFFAVDTFLNFFILLTFTLFSYNFFALAFLAFGLALSCKISAIYFIPIIFLFLFKNKNLISIVYFLISFLAFRFFQPYAFTDIFTPNPLFINNLKTLASYSKPDIFFPPGVQWINRLPLLNSLKNTGVWGLGLAVSFPLIFLLFRFLTKFRFKFNLIFIISAWVVLLFTYQSLQAVHTMRYFLPIYPFISLIFVTLLSRFKIKKSLIIYLLIINSLYAIAFLSIYSRPNSRVQASEWIKKNIPQNKVLSSEYWDDALPLGYSNYQNVPLSLFDPDTLEKWEIINQSLSRVDYLIMSSNRLWASIPRLPDKYPLTSEFYKNLFTGDLNFIKIKTFNSYPGFSLSFLKSCFYLGLSNYPGVRNTWFEKDTDCLYPGVYIRDDTSEEAFTVYDHPQVLIFQKK